MEKICIKPTVSCNGDEIWECPEEGDKPEQPQVDAAQNAASTDLRLALRVSGMTGVCNSSSLCSAPVRQN